MRKLILIFIILFFSYNTFCQCSDDLLFKEAQSCIKKKETEDALKKLDTLITNHPECWEPYYLKAEIYNFSQGDLIEAIHNYTKAIELQKDTANYAHIYLRRGVAYGAFLKYDDALNDLNIAYNYDSLDYYIYYNRGYCKMLMKDYEGSLADFNNALNFTKWDRKFNYCQYNVISTPLDKAANCYLHIGEVFAQQNKHKEAIEFYEMARIRLNYSSIYFKAVSYVALKDTKKAIKEYKIYLRYDKTHSEFRRNTLLKLIELNYNKGNTHMSEKYTLLGLKNFPNEKEFKEWNERIKITR